MSVYYRGRGTYTAGTVNLVPLLKWHGKAWILMTWCHQIDLPKSKLNTELYIFCCTGRQKCTKLHRFAPIFSTNFPRVTPPDSHNPLSDPYHWHASIVPLFQSFCGHWYITIIFAAAATTISTMNIKCIIAQIPIDIQNAEPHLMSVLVLAISSIRFRASNFSSRFSLDSRILRSRSNSVPYSPTNQTISRMQICQPLTPNWALILPVKMLQLINGGNGALCIGFSEH